MAIARFKALSALRRRPDEELDEAAAELKERGVPVDGPYFHEWMPARSVYFTDVDGHQLELCAPV